MGGRGEGRGECGKEDSVKRVRVGKEESRDSSESRIEGSEGRGECRKEESVNRGESRKGGI